MYGKIYTYTYYNVCIHTCVSQVVVLQTKNICHAACRSRLNMPPSNKSLSSKITSPTKKYDGTLCGLTPARTPTTK